MAGVRLKGRKYQGWYMDCRGTRRWFTGTSKKLETRRMAEDLEEKHRKIRLGLVDPKPVYARNAKKPFREAADEYLDWGRTQGGLGENPWGKTHLKERKSKLAWWESNLHLKVMSDLDGILPKVEKLLRSLQENGHDRKSRGVSGKTLKNYADALRAFCRWAKKRSYLKNDPLDSLGPFDDTPISSKRILSEVEIAKLLKAAPEHRRLVYEVALVTGLRARELRSLTPDDVDTARSCLRLGRMSTKNRKPYEAHIPLELAVRLEAYGRSGQARELYTQHFSRKDKRPDTIPDNPLLFVSTHPSRELDKDLKAAGLPKNVPGKGKVDFHALRNCFITRLIEAGGNVKEVQELARHSDPRITLGIYAKADSDRLSTLVDSISTLPGQKKCAVYVPKDESKGDDDDDISPSGNNLDATEEWWRRRDSNPRPFTGTRQATTCLVRLVFLALRLAADVRLRASFH